MSTKIKVSDMAFHNDLVRKLKPIIKKELSKGIRDLHSSLLQDLEQQKVMVHFLATGNWEVSKVSLYDDEGIEGWQWDGPLGKEFTVIGDWDDGVVLPEVLFDFYNATGGKGK